MDSSHLLTLLNQLSSDLTSLETALTPLLATSTNTNVSSSTTNPPTSAFPISADLPLLSKAKLYALASYSINSLVFSHTRLSGADAKQHPVFAELARVKTYFDKIQLAEFPDKDKPTARIDKDAVGRFVRAGLAGNEQPTRGPQQSEPGPAARADKRKSDAEAAPASERGSRKKRKKDKKNQNREDRRKHKSSLPIIASSQASQPQPKPST